MYGNLMSNYYQFWGKAHPKDELSPMVAWHPLAYHSLDVAAVVSRFLESNPMLGLKLAEMFQLDVKKTHELAVFLAGAHDLGKFNPAFQAKAPEVFAVLFPGEPRLVEGENRHSAVGLTTLLEYIQANWFAGTPRTTAKFLITPLLNATCGHHGKPESLRSRPLSGPAGKAAIAYLREFAALCKMEQSPWPELPDPQKLRDASWLLAGIVTVCDWVGSSQEFFPYVPPDLSLEAYWKIALEQASVAVKECGLAQKAANTNQGFDWLFGASRALEEDGYVAKSPTPLQQYADTVELPPTPEPMLFILEDETGAGKTEAALTLANRLVSQGFAKGVFFSLPTQTTANAVFQRVGPVVFRFFSKDTSPTVTLAHGQAKFALARLAEEHSNSESISADLHAWAQEAAKTALLSDFGVGTVDQVVMSGLPVRHVVLRQLGLAQKVLIIDEAHACEPYLLEILCNTLTLHARMGGSAIILSATLPRANKQKLLKAFSEGTRQTLEGNLEVQAYPLATSWSSGKAQEVSISSKAVPKKLRFARVAEAEAYQRITSLLNEGKCVCLMRNTVASAQAAYDFFSARYPTVALVHARFMVADRASNDSALLQSFGKSSGAMTRAGRLTIATQVAEQSLDIDFDEMFTDLAPIDSLLQRAGRRRRHLRDEAGNVGTVDTRADTPMYVIMPVVSDNPKFFDELPSATPYVYPVPGALYRTALIVEKWGTLEIPGKVRDAVEFAYDIEASVPDFLAEAEDRALGKVLAARQQARVAMLRFNMGYSEEAGILGGERSVTRLGTPSVQVVLCDNRGEGLLGAGRMEKTQSQISLRADLLAHEVASDGRVHLRMTATGPHTWQGAVRSARGRAMLATYSRERGFSLTPEK